MKHRAAYLPCAAKWSLVLKANRTSLMFIFTWFLVCIGMALYF